MVTCSVTLRSETSNQCCRVQSAQSSSTRKYRISESNTWTRIVRWTEWKTAADIIVSINPRSVCARKSPRSRPAANLPGTSFKQAHTAGHSRVQSATECLSVPTVCCPHIKKIGDIFRNCRHVEYVSNGSIENTEENHVE